MLALGTAGISSAAPSHGRSIVAQGLDPALSPLATATGPTPPSTPLTVSFILKARNLAALESDVTGGWKGPYLSTAQFAAAYGQTPSVIDSLESFLASYGITTSAYADRLDVTATGTAGQFDRALKVLIGNYSLRGAHGAAAQHIFAAKSDPSVPTSLSADILSVLGLTNYAPYVSDAVKAVSTSTRTPASSTTIPPGVRRPSYFVDNYHLSSVESAGALGQGQTIGIVTLASISQPVPTAFWKILGLKTLPGRLSVKEVDGGAGPVSLKAGSDETTLDVEQSGAIAPLSKILVYQAPNTDYGFVDAFYAAASDNVAGSVSASWGESETAIALSQLDETESPTYGVAFDEADLEMAAQGQSGFVSSGDEGAFTATADAGTTDLTTDSPADSPYITAAGGTTVPGKQTYAVYNSAGTQTGTESVTIPFETSWSWDYLWPFYKAFGAPSEAAVATDFGFDAGSGGGYSTIEPEPSYQEGVSGVADPSHVDYLTPTDVNDDQGIPLPTKFSFDATPTVTTTASPGGRAVPDLSFDADPQTGYAVYDPQFEAAYGTDILEFGGTSFVAPQLNGTTAVMASSLGHRLGFWNPVIYGAATSKDSPFTALDGHQIYGQQYYIQTTDSGKTAVLKGSFSNNDLYYTGTTGAVYNPATGLGYANLSKLLSDFADPS
jgi:subtilase family serine protease